MIIHDFRDVLARDAEGIRGGGDADAQRLQVQIAEDLLFTTVRD